MKSLKKVLVSVFAFSLVISLAGCGSSYDKSASSGAYVATDSFTANGYEGEAFAEEAAAVSDYSNQKTETLNDSARKLIKTYNLSVETENFDDLVAALEARIVGLGGYIENLNTYNGSNYYSTKSKRYSNMTVRIPVQNLDVFVSFIGDSANVTDKSLNVEDVTLAYVDTESRKQTYAIEQERLLALLEKCETVEDMITIESRLSEVRYKLESQESQLRTYDNLVDYSTVYLNISEVVKYTEPEPESYGERLLKSFTEGLSNVIDGLKEFLINFVGVLPALVVLAVIITIIVFVVKAINKSRKKKLEKKQSTRAEELMQQAKNNASQKAQENAK